MKKMLKNSFFAVVMFVIMTFGGNMNVVADTPISVVLDGQKINFDVQPTIIQGCTMVPVRAIFEALGATVEWDEKTKTVTASRYDTNIKMTVNSKKMYVNGETVQLDVPATIIDGRTLVPVRAISEALWCQVGWDGKTKKVSIIDNPFEYVMLYTRDGRSYAFHMSEACKQVAVGWFWDLECEMNEKHLFSYKDSYSYCKDCGEYVDIKPDMTKNEINNAKQVQYISNRQIWYSENDEAFILAFSLLDEKSNEISCPVNVGIRIFDDNGEIVYDCTRTMTTDDFGTWTYNNGAVKKYQCAVYLYDYLLTPGTVESGKVYFEVYNDYCNFDTSTLTINNNLPLKESYVEIPNVPVVITELDWENKTVSKCKITNIYTEINGNDLTIYFTGEKTFDHESKTYGRSCKIAWKLLDSEGYVVDSGTVYTPALFVGDKFKDVKEYAWDTIIPGEEYKIVIMDVK